MDIKKIFNEFIRECLVEKPIYTIDREYYFPISRNMYQFRLGNLYKIENYQLEDESLTSIIRRGLFHQWVIEGSKPFMINCRLGRMFHCIQSEDNERYNPSFMSIDELIEKTKNMTQIDMDKEYLCKPL